MHGDSACGPRTFQHLPEFGLRLFQQPSGLDLAGLGKVRDLLVMEFVLN